MCSGSRRAVVRGWAGHCRPVSRPAWVACSSCRRCWSQAACSCWTRPGGRDRMAGSWRRARTWLVVRVSGRGSRRAGPGVRRGRSRGSPPSTMKRWRLSERSRARVGRVVSSRRRAGRPARPGGGGVVRTAEVLGCAFCGVSGPEVGAVAAECLDPGLTGLVEVLGDQVGHVVLASAGHRDVRCGGAGALAEHEVPGVGGLALGAVLGGGVGELDVITHVAGRE